MTSEPERVLELSKRPMLEDTESGHYTLNWKFTIGTNEPKSKILFPLVRKANFKSISDDFSSLDRSDELKGLNAQQS